MQIKVPSKNTFLTIIIAGFIFLFSPISAYANYSAPSWWNSDQCDSTHYSGGGHTPQLLTTWLGIEVCGYGPAQSPYNWSDVGAYFPSATVPENEWECTELVKRYLYLAFGLMPLSSTNGDQVVAHYANAYPNILRAVSNTNGNPDHVWPKVGDVLSYSDTHTAIVSGVTITDEPNGDATLDIIEQNASLNGTTTQKFVGWKIKGDIDDPTASGSDTVTAWLTPRTWKDVSTGITSGIQNTLYSVTDTSSTDVWAVGYNYNSGENPIAIHWDGSSWSSNAFSSGFSNKWLAGVSAISSSDVLAVGNNDALGTTFAVRYNGSSWSSINSDSPGNGPNLAAVSSDTSGDAWAVGGSYNSSWTHYSAMIQQYMGSSTGFQNWSPTGSTGTIPLPSGTTDSRLNAVSTYSSSEAWAVGYTNNSNNSNFKGPLAYYWNGTTWTEYTVPIPSGNNDTKLNGVKIISPNDVWAVGSSNGDTFIAHWTGATNGWSIVSSPSPSATNLDQLSAISADNSNHIFAVGNTRDASNHIKTLILRYDGFQWSQETSPNPGGTASHHLYGVTITTAGTEEGEAWAVGDNGSNPLSLQNY